ELARVARAQRELALLILRGEAVRVGGDDETADRLDVVRLAGLRPDDRYLRGRTVGDPHLGAVQDPAALRLSRDRDHPGGVRPVVRLREPETADHLPRAHPGQPVPLLLVRAEGVDRI